MSEQFKHNYKYKNGTALERQLINWYKQLYPDRNVREATKEENVYQFFDMMIDDKRIDIKAGKMISNSGTIGVEILVEHRYKRTDELKRTSSGVLLHNIDYLLYYDKGLNLAYWLDMKDVSDYIKSNNLPIYIFDEEDREGEGEERTRAFYFKVPVEDYKNRYKLIINQPNLF